MFKYELLQTTDNIYFNHFINIYKKSKFLVPLNKIIYSFHISKTSKIELIKHRKNLLFTYFSSTKYEAKLL